LRNISRNRDGFTTSCANIIGYFFCSLIIYINYRYFRAVRG